MGSRQPCPNVFDFKRLQEADFRAHRISGSPARHTPCDSCPVDHSRPSEPVHQESHISQRPRRNGVASREIFDAIRIPLAVCDPVTGDILSANDAFSHDFGYEIERPGALTLSATGAARQTSLLSSRLARTLGGAPQAFPWVVRGKDGREHSVELSLAVVHETGARRILAQFRPIGGHAHDSAALLDVTDRERSEAALRESQERLDLAVGGADLGLWDWDIPTGRVTHNARWAEMLGFCPDELEPRFSTWQKLVHPDDKPIVLRRLQDHLDGKTPLYEAELRLRASDGTWRWTLDRGKVVRRDPSGAPIRMSGTQLDITERREAENRLRESLQEKELLLREIHHRVKNNLQVISSLFNLQAQTINDPKVLAALKESHNRVRSMGLVHHVMYQAADFAAIDLVDYVQTLTRSLYRSYAVDPEAVLLSVDIAHVRLGIDAAIPCGLIINELVSNALRHAYPEGRRGTLSVTLAHNSDGTHTLTVRDDGIGLPPDLTIPPAATLGLALVETLSRQLEGTLWIDRTEGTAVSVRFPGRPRA
jgi:PAS domain S-box-containing protein